MMAFVRTHPLALLALCLLGLGAAYLFAGLGPNAGFILPLRATRLGGMLVVGASIAVATVLFQTVAQNRILTPSIMGFDALYVLMQTALVAVIGAVGFTSLPKALKFGLEVGVMITAAVLLFGTLLGRGPRDIARMILTGVILGVLFRSLSGFVARVMDPNAYSVVQSVTFASFTRIDATLLLIGGSAAFAAIALAFALSRRLDVMALGRPVAVSLGLSYERLMLLVLALVALLVSVSTALVGPVAFFGLIVVGLAHALVGADRHARLLPAAALIAGIVLVGGQLIFERLVGQQSTLSVVVECIGGLVFLWLLLKGRVR